MRYATLLQLVLVPGCVAAASASAQVTPGTPPWTFTERLRLDANTEDFSAIQLTRQGNAPFYIGPRREIVIPFQQDGAIRIYDSTGKKVASLGQRGSGPGEFRNFFRLGWMRDTMWVYDAVQRRMTFYDPQRKLVRTHVTAETLRQPVDSGNRNPHVISDFAPSTIAPNGNTIGQIIRVEGRTPGGWLNLKYFVAAVSPNDSVKALTEIPAAAVSPRVWMSVPTGTRNVFGIIPFGNDAIYAVAPAGDRYAILTTDRAAKTFTVTMYEPTGARRYAKKFPFTPALLPKGVSDSAITAATRTMRQPPDIVAAMQKELRAAMPPNYPPVTSVVLARDGTAWIRLYGTDPRTAPFLVLNAKGDAIGSVALPRTQDIVEADGRTVWGVETDADGLVSVVVWTVNGRSASH